ncbi:glucosamine-6-phosphate deaminase [Subtercola boreus]|uniref:Glucosamine-6-phosphate deaminase n=1 Tax=Subtercola boreus TaxID=120213 RepID=A0A3E0W7F8_9MICO|nr:glucosamine-6-phosphate deaminase [Subtercola boreus]RFA18815.1 glucosamine-6-phosphate deaminase [Subtercola boreus]RFA18929.1 glucosamine-6-phosphate deaminase [Subtercola boreus]RFA25467.1 glucosamine-6-phosphate deaminase [Subtercola boreus]
MAEVVVVSDQEAAGDLAAHIILDTIRRRPEAVLGLATGSTPLSTYRRLAQQVKERSLDVSHVRGFALDEYVGLPHDHPESYRSVITRDVVVPVGLNPSQIHVPDGALAGIEHAGADYEGSIADAGGIDVQLLGIGTDGHIGFNEPGSSFASLTRVKTLSEQTRRDNARFFDDQDDVPMHCITQGLATILRAGHLVLLAFGEGKAEALAGAVEGPVSASNPGSAIQLHPRVTVIADEAAASALRHVEYYRYAYAHKPSWQGF